jgi:predicted transcriptional regulator
MPSPGPGPKVTDAELLKQIRLWPEPFVTSQDLVPRTDYTGRQGVNNRLQELTEEGYLKRREVGSKAVVYWLTEKGKEKAAEAD